MHRSTTCAATDFERIHQARKGHAREQETSPVESTGIRFPNVLDVPGDQVHAEEPDRHIDVEDPSPGRISDDESPQGWTYDGPQECGDCEPGHGRYQILRGHRSKANAAANWSHHSAAQSLDEPSRDKKG